jgi:hypothetical protein
MTEQWTPKVGDRVMVGEHGPYEVQSVNDGWRTAVLALPGDLGTAMFAWLTPAPDPEPDEPTAPGALVQDDAGRYLTRGGTATGRWYGPNVQGYTWDFIERPITVVLADPAEVETLRAEVEKLREWQVQHGMTKGMAMSAGHVWRNAPGNKSCWCDAGDDHDESPLDMKLTVTEKLRDQMLAVAQEAKRLHQERDRARAERDELQRRIDNVLGEVELYATKEYLRFSLRGES